MWELGLLVKVVFSSLMVLIFCFVVYFGMVMKYFIILILLLLLVKRNGVKFLLFFSCDVLDVRSLCILVKFF